MWNCGRKPFWYPNYVSVRCLTWKTWDLWSYWVRILSFPPETGTKQAHGPRERIQVLCAGWPTSLGCDTEAARRTECDFKINACHKKNNCKTKCLHQPTILPALAVQPPSCWDPLCASASHRASAQVILGHEGKPHEWSNTTGTRWWPTFPSRPQVLS